MAAGWAELLRWIRRQASAEEPDAEATWTRFRKLSERSEYANILKHVVRVGRVLPNEERYRLAVAITRLLAPIEWPARWSEPLPGLVAALDALVEATNPDAAESFFALHELEDDAVLQRVGHRVLLSARDLLRHPCRRDELAIVARLCNAGNAACITTYRRAVEHHGGSKVVDPAARDRYRSAFEAYAEAAGQLNDAAGAVLFEGLGAAL